MRKNLTKLFALLVAGLAALSTLSAQSIADAMYANDIAAFNRKIKLTETDLKKGSFIADYLRDLPREIRDMTDGNYASTHEYSQEMLDNLIAQGASVDSPDKYGLGPLYWACFYDNADAVKSLIAAKAKVNAKWSFTKAVQGINATWPDETRIEYPDYFNKATGLYQCIPANAVVRPLAIALFNSSPEIVQALLAAGADPTGTVYSVKGSKGAVTESVFDLVCGMFAVSKSSCDTAGAELGYVPMGDLGLAGMNRKGIVMGRISPNPRQFGSAYYIWQAAMKLPAKGRPTVAKAYMANIFAAACAQDTKAVKKYLAVPEFNNTQFLPYALYIGNLDYVDFIVEFAGKNINDPLISENDTLLSYAIKNNLGKTAIGLLSHGITFDHKKEIDSTPEDYYYAKLTIDSGNIELLKALFAAKLDPNAEQRNSKKGEGGYNLLADAANSLEMTTALKEAGADLAGGQIYRIKGLRTLFDYNQDNPLSNFSWALFVGNKSVVEYYLNNGVNLDTAADPLLFAIHGHNPEIVQLLIDKGVDVKSPIELNSGDMAQYGMLPLDLAQKVLEEEMKPAEHTFDGVLHADREENVKRSQAVVDVLTKAVAAYKDADHPFVLKQLPVKGGTVTLTYGSVTRKTTLSDFTVYSPMTGKEFARYTGKPAGTFEQNNDSAFIRASFYDAAALANDLSTAEGLTPVYVLPATAEARAANDAAIGINKDANGYRLPSYAEVVYMVTGAAGREAQDWIYGRSPFLATGRGDLRYWTATFYDSALPKKDGEPEETDPMPAAITIKDNIVLTFISNYSYKDRIGAEPSCHPYKAGIISRDAYRSGFFFVRNGSAAPAAK